MRSIARSLAWLLFGFCGTLLGYEAYTGSNVIESWMLALVLVCVLVTQVLLLVADWREGRDE